MIFTTWHFLLYMSLVFTLYWWVVPARWRRGFLFLVSLAYFTYSYPPFALLLGAMTLAVYGMGNAIFWLREKHAPTEYVRAALIAGLALCTVVLVYFKYSRMLLGLWNDLGHLIDGRSAPPSALPALVVPLGISFFTFEFIHYLTDLYLGKLKRVSLLDFSLFIFFFPSLISGPVKRFQIFQEQTENAGGFQASYLAEGLHRIVLGLAKKLIVADTATLFTEALSHPATSSRTAVWIAMYAFAVKIYYDFSGYTDIAIGCAQMLGYRLPENFNRPYREPNISRFWNNWHMSLSSWIRDYLFIPLGGSRCSPLRVLFNLTLVMALCGLWHGANLTFLVWGLWHGLGLVGVRLYQPLAKRVPASRPVRWLSTGLTIQFVCFGWVFFAAPSLSVALEAFRRMI